MVDPTESLHLNPFFAFPEGSALPSAQIAILNWIRGDEARAVPTDPYGRQTVDFSATSPAEGKERDRLSDNFI